MFVWPDFLLVDLRDFFQIYSNTEFLKKVEILVAPFLSISLSP